MIQKCFMGGTFFIQVFSSMTTVVSQVCFSLFLVQQLNIGYLRVSNHDSIYFIQSKGASYKLLYSQTPHLTKDHL